MTDLEQLERARKIADNLDNYTALKYLSGVREDILPEAKAAILSLIQRVREAEKVAHEMEDLIATPILIWQERVRNEALEEAAKAIDNLMLCRDDEGREILAVRSGDNKIGLAYAQLTRALKDQPTG